MQRFKVYISFLFITVVLYASGQPFVPNLGQWKEDFQYKWKTAQGSIFIEKDGLTFNWFNNSPLHFHHEHLAGETFDVKSINHHAFKMTFVNGFSEEFIETEKATGYHNYLLGKDQSNWRQKVPIYNRIEQKEIYPGVDIQYYQENGNLKYDLLLTDHLKAENIQMKYEGLDTLYLEEGYLIMRTSIGEFVEQKPIAWQIKDGEHVNIECDFILSGNIVSFKVKPKFKKLPITIDPQYVFSTYSGSYADNFGYTACFDSTGNLYGGGIAYSFGSYPTTLGALQDTFQGGDIDIAVSKFTSDGTQLIYSTYIGGSDNEQPHSMVASNDNGLVIMGITGSQDFPVTTNALDTSFNGGPSTSLVALFPNGIDLFVMHLDSTGGALVGSTFIGGTHTDGANQGLAFNYGDESRGEVIYDSTVIYVVSCTRSNDFMGLNLGTSTDQNAVIFSLNNDCSNYINRKVIGGTSEDAAYSLRVLKENGNRNLMVAGGTKSNNFPTSSNAYQSTYGGGFSDGFILNYDLNLDSVIHSTFNGTNQYDQNFFLDLDFDNKVYVIGQSKGAYPTSPNVWKIANSAQYIHKFSNDLSTSIKSTTFGDGSLTTVDISPTAFMVDYCKNVFVSGWGGQVGPQEGSTIGLPTTSDAYDSTTNGNDFYFFVLDGSWNKLEYASFFGLASREHVDGGTSRFSKDGTIYQAICAGCGNQSFPIFPSNVWSTTNNSQNNNCNMGCTKVVFDYQSAEVNVTVNPDSNCIPYQLAFIDSSSNVDEMIWDFGDGTTFTGFNPNKVFEDTGTYTITVIGHDTLCNTSDTTSFNIYLLETFIQADFSIEPYDTCSRPFRVVLNNNTTNAASSEWYFGNGSTSTDANPTYIYPQEGEYEIKLVVFDNICGKADTATQTVYFKSPGTISEFELEYNSCSSDYVVNGTQFGTGFQIHEWDFGDGDTQTGSTFTHIYENPGVYQITLSSKDTICNTEIISQETIEFIPALDEDKLVPNIFTPNGDNVNENLKLVDPFIGARFSEFNLELYNRWGNLVYSTNDPFFEWNGKIDGELVAEGVYFWIINTFDICSDQQEYKGVVHLLR